MSLHRATLRRAILGLGALTLLAAIVQPATADTIFYSDQAAFDSAMASLPNGATGSEGFERFYDNNRFPEQPGPSVNFGAFTLSASSGNVAVGYGVAYGVTQGNHSATVGTGTTATFTFAKPVTAFGLDVTSYVSGGDMTRTLIVGGDVSDTVTMPAKYYPGPSNNGTSIDTQFFGVISSTPFTTITFTLGSDPANHNSGSYGVLGFDNVQFKNAPEPASLVLWSLGLVGAGAFYRRRLARQRAAQSEAAS